VRRQLVARYKSKARLTIEARMPRGTSAAILIPLRAAATAWEGSAGTNRRLNQNHGDND
jgi:hypothetical protein